MKLFLFIVSAFLLVASPVFGATYYIDPTCETPGDGTSSTCSGGAHDPFDEWSDVVWAAGNTYAQKGGTTTKVPITVGGSGTSGSVITITSYGTGKAILNGGVTLSSGWTENDPVAGTYSITSTFGTQPLYEDDVPLKYGASASTLNAGEVYWGSGKNYYKPSSGVPSDHTLVYGYQDNWGPGGAIYIGDTGSYITITNMSFVRWPNGIINGEVPGASEKYHTGITITDCDFDDIEKAIGIVGKDATSSNINISNNEFSYCGSSIELYDNTADTEGGSTRWTNVTIANNTITHCSQGKGTDYFWSLPAGLPACDKISNSGADREGIGTQSMDTANVYGNSVSGKCAGIAIYTGYYHNGYDVSVYKNFINTEDVGFYYMPTLLSISFYNNKAYSNIIIGDTGSFNPNAAAVWLGRLSSPDGTNYFYNNTIKCSRNGITGKVDDWKVKNNIICGEGIGYYIGFSNTPSNLDIDYNLYYNGTGWVYADSLKNWAAWKGYGFDGNSPEPADPLFLSPGGNNYHPGDLSPAIDAGVDLGDTYKLDYDGVDQDTYTPWEIGAFVYYVGVCGDSTCDGGECISGCTADCSIEDCCGIEGCNAAIGETAVNCAGDCGSVAESGAPNLSSVTCSGVTIH